MSLSHSAHIGSVTSTSTFMWRWSFPGDLSYLTGLFEQRPDDRFILERDWIEDQSDPD